jgi:hypothetical protein
MAVKGETTAACVVPPGMHSDASRSNPARAILDPDIFAVSIFRFVVQRRSAEQVRFGGSG